MWKTILRQPYAMLGGIALISILTSMMQIHDQIMKIINSYQVVTHYLWEICFGWLPFYTTIPTIIKDYVSFAIITFGANYRSIKSLINYIPFNLAFSLILSLFWPVSLTMQIWTLIYFEKMGMKKHIKNSVERYKKADKELKEKWVFSHLTDEVSKELDKQNKPETKKVFKVEGDSDKLAKLRIDSAIQFSITTQALWIYAEFVLWAIAILCISYGLFFFS